MEKIHNTNRGKNQFSYQDRPYTNRDWLYQKYVVEGLSLKKIAKLTGNSNKSGTTIHRWIRRFNFTPHKALARGENNTRWKGGKYCSKGYNYILVREEHPNALLKGKYCKYVAEHHLVMEKHIGRFLTKDECVHHKNGVKNDNRIENLMLMLNSSEHTSLEQKINLFAKQLIWGNLNPEIDKNRLEVDFNQFARNSNIM